MVAIIGLFVLSSHWAAQLARADSRPSQLQLAVQPILSEAKTREAFQPLADYLSKFTGKKVVIRTMPNFLAYWDTIRRPDGYELILDAAHFTDYRVQKLGYKVLVKIPDSVSYSLIVPEDQLVFEPHELVGKRIATLGSPSIGAARLASLFPNPVRQPIIVETASSEEGMRLLLSGKVHAAILPTPLVFRQMTQGGGGISVVVTTEPVPHIALSAAPNIGQPLRNKIRKALLNAGKTAQGKAMLKNIGFPKFDPANDKLYTGQAQLLEKYWGY